MPLAGYLAAFLSVGAAEPPGRMPEAQLADFTQDAERTEGALYFMLSPDHPSIKLSPDADQKLSVAFEGSGSTAWHEDVAKLTVARTHNVRGVFICTCRVDMISEVTYSVDIEDEPLEPVKVEEVPDEFISALNQGQFCTTRLYRGFDRLEFDAVELASSTIYLKRETWEHTIDV